MDYNIKLFWKDGYFVQDINGRQLILSPWVGEEITYYQDNLRSWYRETLTKHSPNDLMKYLKRENNDT